MGAPGWGWRSARQPGRVIRESCPKTRGTRSKPTEEPSCSRFSARRNHRLSSNAAPPAVRTLLPRRCHRTAASMTILEKSASQMIDERARELDDWRGSVLKRMRELIHEADPEVVEEWKWVKKSSPGTPVWSHDGGICTGEAYKQVVKLTFFHGASLKDPARLFNSSLGGNIRRAIDIREDDAIDEAAFKELIRAAVAFNAAKRKK